MNRRDFYKELMQEYTFDTAKVRRGAKLSSLKGRTGSVRVGRGNRRWWHVPATVAAAAIALVFGLQSAVLNGMRGVPTVDDMSIDARFDFAGRETAHIEGLSFGTRTLFLSFNDSLTFSEMQNALDSVSDTGNILIESVYVLGAGGEVEILTLAEVISSRVEPDRVIGAKIQAPVTLVAGLREQPEVALVEVMTNELTEETFIPLVAAPNWCPERDSDNGGHGDIADIEPIDGVISLETFVNFGLSGVVRAEFVDDYRFTAITHDVVLLCEIFREDDSDELQIRIVTEFDFEGELLFSFYCESSRTLVMRSRSGGVNAIHVMSNDGSVAQVVDSGEELSVLAVTESYLYYSAGRRVVYKYSLASATAVEHLTFEHPVSFERNAALSAFVINTGDAAQVFDARTGTLSTSEATTQGLLFYRNSTNVLTDGVEFYTLALDTVCEPESVLRFAERSNLSAKFSVSEISEHGVRILMS
jgi:hypothetical protein